jgi:DNA-binding SARP family transcriptional activator
MEFEILGTFRVDGATTTVAATKPRRLLATLLLHPNRFVSTDQLADALWDGAPPRSALANLRTYVLALREFVPGIATEPAGYRLTVDDTLDAVRMELLATSAATLRRDGDVTGALAAYQAALALWRGAPLEDLTPCAVWRPALARLNRLRHTVSDGLTDLALAAGDHQTALDVLRDRLADDPYDEDRLAQLVRSLHACGRRHEARTAFRDAVRILADDLEVTPGDTLLAAGELVAPRTIRAPSLTDTLDRAVAAATRLPYRYFGVPVTAADVPASTSQDAVAWFHRLAPTLADTLRTAAAAGLHEQVWRLAATSSAYFDLRGPFNGWRAAHQVALTSARACDSRRGTAIILRDLGLLAMYRDDWRTARRAFTSASAAFASLDDHIGVAVATVGLGSWHRERGELSVALSRFESALATFSVLGDGAGEAVARSAIGSVWLLRKDPDAAESWLSTAYDMATSIGDEHRRAQILERLAVARAMRGEHRAAVADLRCAHTILTAMADHRCAAKVATKLLANAAQA